MNTNIVVVILLVLLGVGCTPAKIDVRTDAVLDKTANWEINIKKSVFSSINSELEKACEVVNMKISTLLDSLSDNLKNEADTFFITYVRDTMSRPSFNYQLYTEDSIFRADAKYISIRLAAYTYAGGAHGISSFYAFNYDIKRQKFLIPQEIVDFDQPAEMNVLLEKNFVNHDSCFSEKPTLNGGFTALNITTDAVCFTYPHYVLGAYYCGIGQIAIPDTELKALFLLNNRER